MPVQKYDLQRPPEQGGGWEERYWKPINTPVLRPDGTIACIIHRVEDVTELVRLRQADAQREERLRLLEAVVVNANDAVLITDGEPLDEPGPRIRYVNRAFTQMTGYEPKEAVGRTARFLVGPGTDGAVLQQLRTAMEKREPLRVELLNYRKDGSEFWAEVSVAPVFDASGRLTHFTAVQHETTERRRAEENAVKLAREEAARAEAEAAQEKIEAILESITDGFIALDEELRYTYVNRRAEDFLGLRRDELLGRCVHDTYPHFVGSELETRLQQAQREQTPQHYEAVSEIGGHWFEVHVYPSRDGLSVFFRDIEDKRRAEEALRESESRYRTLFDSSLEGVILATHDGRVLSMNNAACRKVRCSREEACSSLNVFDFIDRSDPRVAAVLKGPGHSGAFRGELPFKRADGTTFEAEASLVTFSGEQGTEQLGVFVRDITERKRAEEMRARLAAILESTPDFVGSFDIQGRGLMLNQSARRMLNIPESEDVASLSLARLYPSDVAHRVLTEGISTALRDGVWRGETALLTREGRTYPVSQVLLAHRDVSGQVAFFSTVMRDIAELKRTEELQKFLSEASRTLVGSLEYEATLESVARIAVPRLADFCIVYVLEGDTLRTRAMAHADPAQERWLEELRHTVPPHEAVVGVRGVLRTGEAELVPEVTPAWLWAACPDPKRFRILSELGPRSCMVLPLVARDRTLG